MIKDEFDEYNEASSNKGLGESITENPYKTIQITPDYFNLFTSVHDLCIQLLSGFLWEAKYSRTFVAVHPEIQKVRELLYRLTWLHQNEFWPSKDEMLELAFVDFARLLPALWD